MFYENGLSCTNDNLIFFLKKKTTKTQQNLFFLNRKMEARMIIFECEGERLFMNILDFLPRICITFIMRIL